MIKILIGFILFAALAIFILMKSGADVNLGDEHAGQKAEHEAPAKAQPGATTPAAPVTK
ncbi:MAG: hypothetical protein RL020_258 [Pseudomonadota bacterium]|jgi:hypothetical protein